MITISLTSMAEREESLKQVIESLLPQADKINVFLHGYTSKPEFLNNEKIRTEFDWEYSDHKDNDKFFFLKDIKSGYHIVVDDDLIYPKDFVQYMIKWCKKLGNKSIVGMGGRRIKRLPIANYYLDSIQYSVFSEIEQPIELDVLLTCCICYNVKQVPLKLDISSLEPFMSDIHLSLWAKANNVSMVAVSHSKDYLKHYPINFDNTIFAQESTKCFIQTEKINSHPEFYQIPKEYSDEMPLVSVVVVNTRMRTNNEYLYACLESIRNQTYWNVEVIMVDNMSKIYTIGKCWNDGVRKAKGDWVLFVGDDDFISNDYISSLSILFPLVTNEVHITSFLTMFRTTEERTIREARELLPTGMWKRDYLLENPAVEDRVKFVDTEMMDKVKDRRLVLEHHYGYFYRSHQAQTSGMKAMKDEASTR